MARRYRSAAAAGVVRVVERGTQAAPRPPPRPVGAGGGAVHHPPATSVGKWKRQRPVTTTPDTMPLTVRRGYVRHSPARALSGRRGGVRPLDPSLTVWLSAAGCFLSTLLLLSFPQTQRGPPTREQTGALCSARLHPPSSCYRSTTLSQFLKLLTTRIKAREKMLYYLRVSLPVGHRTEESVVQSAGRMPLANEYN